MTFPQFLHIIASVKAVFLVAKYVFFFQAVRSRYTSQSWWWTTYISVDEVGLSEYDALIVLACMTLSRPVPSAGCKAVLV